MNNLDGSSDVEGNGNDGDREHGRDDGWRGDHRHRSGHDQFRSGDHLRRETPGRAGARRGDPALVRRPGRHGQRHRRAPGAQPGRRRPRADRALRQAPDGHRHPRADGRGRIHAPGDFGLHPQGPQGAGGPGPGPGRAQGGHHRPGLFHGCPAPSDAGSRRDRRLDGGADHQRTHGRRPELRKPRPGAPEDPRLRPRRRDVRRLGGRDRGRSGRGPGLHRGQPAWRRRLRRARRRAPQRPHRDGDGHRRRPRGSSRAGAAEPGGRARQDRALGSTLRPHRGGPHRLDGRRGEASLLRADPRRFRERHRRPPLPHHKGGDHRPQRRRRAPEPARSHSAGRRLDPHSAHRGAACGEAGGRSPTARSIPISAWPSEPRSRPGSRWGRTCRRCWST